MRLLMTIVFLVLAIGVQSQVTVCPECPVSTIKEALLIAEDFQTILIKEGTYNESNLEIVKPLTIIGEGYPVIDGQKQGYIFQVMADSVSIRGLKIQNVGFSHTKDFAAIHAFKSDYLVIRDNILENVFFGILVEKSENGKIEKNIVYGENKKEFYSGNGIHLWHCQNMDILENRLKGLRDGIYFEFVDDSRVEKNISFQNVRYGLHFMFSNRDKYTNNHFFENGAGVAVMFSKFISMKNNTFRNNWGPTSYGLLLKEIYDAEIEANQFISNTVAVNVDGSTRVTYRSNHFERNGWAIKVTGGCYTNSFEENNFISNSFDVSYNSKVNDNYFTRNYWSGYTGYDLDGDGFGDVPYRPVKLYSYVVNRTPETIVLMRSLFIDLINFSEKVTPLFTPDNLLDDKPMMRKVTW